MSKKNERKVKEFHVDIKAVAEDGSFEGYGSIFGNVDAYGDVVVKGAFQKTLQDRANKVKLLWQHDSTNPIGVFTGIGEDDTGLKMKGQLALDTQKGAEAYALLKMGALDGMSIGYQTIQDEFDPKAGVRYLKEVKLYEVSLVTFPANEEATVTSVKTMFEDLTTEQKMLVAKYINSLKDDSSLTTTEPLSTQEKHSEQKGADNNNTDKPEEQDVLHLLEQLSISLKQTLKGR